MEVALRRGKGAIKHMVTKYFWEKLEDQSL